MVKELDHEPDLAAGRADETSLAYLGRWQRLVSTTNWEKGRIIHEWRAALRSEGASPQQYSDEAWSRRVANVSGPHVGRLRRVFERFGPSRTGFAGLYWSHFHAALDWPDAEMWLEGAVQNGWSVAAMRYQRWEALGAAADQRPREEDILAAELDEDADAPLPPEIQASSVREPGGGPAALDEGGGELGEPQPGVPFDAQEARYPAEEVPEPVRPFERLPDLPDDLADAFEASKLAILRHKLSGWREISREHVLAGLESLKQLALAPAESLSAQ